MKITVAPTSVSGTVRAIASKSYAHRLLTAAALSDAPCKVICSDVSDDVLATARCLGALGAGVTRTANGFDVTPVSRADGNGVCEADCGESGSTLRFLLPVACALGKTTRFTGKGRLPARPLGGLTECLKAHGIAFSADAIPFTVSGKLHGNEYVVPANVSSQYVSGMLLALCATDGRSLLCTEGQRVSQGYIEITLDALRMFGADVEERDGAFLVTGGLHSPGLAVTEGDWSNAAFWLAAGVLTGDVSVTGLNPDSKQSDKRIADLLLQAGADVSFRDGVWRARKSELSPIRADLTDIPDLAPVLSVLAGAAKGDSVFSGVSRLRAKESDRLAAIMHNLSVMGVTSEYDETADTLTVRGGKLSPFEARSFNDHRMVMSAAVAALVCGGSVDDGFAVAKSYPDFFAVLETLGGKISESV